MVIIDYYHSLSLKEKAAFRLEVMRQTKMSNSAFYKKIKKNTFKPAEVMMITSIMEDFINAGEN